MDLKLWTMDLNGHFAYFEMDFGEFSNAMFSDKTLGTPESAGVPPNYVRKPRTAWERGRPARPVFVCRKPPGSAGVSLCQEIMGGLSCQRSQDACQWLSEKFAKLLKKIREMAVNSSLVWTLTVEDPGLENLPWKLIENLRTLNPWWDGKRGPELPLFRRWAFDQLGKLVRQGLTPAVVLRGPRQVGKTVLLRQLIESLLAEGVEPCRILYVPFDELPTLRTVQESVLTISRWFENNVLRLSFNEAGRDRRPAYLFFDEVQNLDTWAPQTKNLVDNHMVRVVVTGSSSLRIEAGRDSLAGRITTVDVGSLLLREIARIHFGQTTEPFWQDNADGAPGTPEFWKSAVAHAGRESEMRWQTFAAFSERGGYPMAHHRHSVPWPEMASYLNETVIKRAIQHDLRMGRRGQRRDENLLEAVFRLCCRYAGQCPGQSVLVPQIQQTLNETVGWNRVLTYLRFLEGTLLVRLIPPLELRLKRQKSPSKVCLCDHALRASWLQEVVPLDEEGLKNNPHLSDLAGRLVESILGYFLASIPNLEVAYFPARSIEPEVDFVLTVGTRRIPIEVKYRKRIDPHEDTFGLRAFLEKSVYNAPFGLLVTMNDDVVIPDPRIIPISLSSFLWLR